jgi:hypothetical protein
LKTDRYFLGFGLRLDVHPVVRTWVTSLKAKVMMFRRINAGALTQFH